MAIRQTASMEDYLEAIALLHQGEEGVTVTKISEFLGVKKPSVTSALTKLVEAGLVSHKRYGRAELTPMGLKTAQDVYHRHKTLRHLLVEILKVDPKIAEEDACRMEHFLSPSSLDRLAKFIEFNLNCPQGIPECLKGFNYYLKYGKRNKEILAKCQVKKNVKTKSHGSKYSERNVADGSKAIE